MRFVSHFAYGNVPAIYESLFLVKVDLGFTIIALVIFPV